MKAKVYLETTIPSFLVARPSRDIVLAGKQETTRQWWKTRKNSFDVFVSPFVIEEAGLGDSVASADRLRVIESMPVLAVDEQVTMIANHLIAQGAVPTKAATDASHIAVAARHGMDFLLTWNCKHIANAMILRAVERVVENLGLQLPIICTPDELMGEDDD